MKVEVELNKFMNGKIRLVDVPKDKLNGSLKQKLEQVFYYGQNDFQPQQLPSVSMGDVVRYKRRPILGLGSRLQETKAWRTDLQSPRTIIERDKRDRLYQLRDVGVLPWGTLTKSGCPFTGTAALSVSDKSSAQHRMVNQGLDVIDI